MIDLLAADPCQVARRLLGMRLRVRGPHGEVTVRLTETEAYAGEGDPASHASRGLTQRNAVMFGPGGFLYVYRSHGLHWCCNVVTGPEGAASAVLLRAGEVVGGVEVARERRGSRVPDGRLASGPGNLAQALGITHHDNGAPIKAGARLTLEGTSVRPDLVSWGPRVGVTRAPDHPWRYWITADPTVTKYRRSPRAANPQHRTGRAELTERGRPGKFS
jgi:DNA-3-methyladenine glycosylase